MIFNYKILDSLQMNVSWKNLEGIYLGCNKHFGLTVETMFGLDVSEHFVGKSDSDMPWNSIASKIRDMDSRAIKTRSTAECVVEFELDGAGKKVFALLSAPIINQLDSAVIEGTMMVSAELDSSKLLGFVEGRQSNLIKDYGLSSQGLVSKMLEGLTGVVSAKSNNKDLMQELYTENNSGDVIGQNFLNQLHALNKKDKSNILDQLKQNSKKLLRLTVDNMDLSDLLSNKIELNLEKQNITKFIKHEVNDYNKLYNKNKVVCESSFEHYALCDVARMSQVLYNLLEYAREIEGNDAKIFVGIEKAFLHNSTLIPGIRVYIRREEGKKHRYDIKLRMKDYRNSNGLVLALCNSFISMHFGELAIESGQNTSVISSFTIPSQLGTIKAC